MFIDYVTLLLLNTSAGFFILAVYVLKGFDEPDGFRWAPAFGIVGFISTVCGLYMIFTWPLPGVYNSLFGEMSVLFGTLFLASSWALSKKWDLSRIGIYAFFAGLAAILLGMRIFHLDMHNIELTIYPKFTALGFLLSGLAGLLAYAYVSKRKRIATRRIAVIFLITTSLLWAVIAGMGFWGHMKSFSDWKPKEMLRIQDISSKENNESER